jgi:hypothetical protein
MGSTAPAEAIRGGRIGGAVTLDPAPEATGARTDRAPGSVAVAVLVGE